MCVLLGTERGGLFQSTEMNRSLECQFYFFLLDPFVYCSLILISYKKFKNFTVFPRNLQIAIVLPFPSSVTFLAQSQLIHNLYCPFW